MTGKTFFFQLLIIILCGSCFSALYGKNYAIFKEIVRSYAAIRTIDSDIRQIIQEGNERKTYMGRFRANAEGLFRLDYFFPEKQVVVCSKLKLYWYYPHDKILYQVETLSMESSRFKISPLSGFADLNEKNFKVRFYGKHLLGFFTVAHLYEIENNKTGHTTLFWISKKNKILLQKIVRDRKGYELTKEIYGDFKKIGDMFIPFKIDVIVRTMKGITRSTTYYKNIKLNRYLSSSLFVLSYPKDIILRQIQ